MKRLVDEVAIGNSALLRLIALVRATPRFEPELFGMERTRETIAVIERWRTAGGGVEPTKRAAPTPAS